MTPQDIIQPISLLITQDRYGHHLSSADIALAKKAIEEAQRILSKYNKETK